jgi:hypothetical protein
MTMTRRDVGLTLLVLGIAVLLFLVSGPGHLLFQFGASATVSIVGVVLALLVAVAFRFVTRGR